MTENAADTAATQDSGTDQILANAVLAARTTEDFRCKDTVLLDMRGITPLVDYFIISTATSPRQMKALAQEIDILLKRRGQPCIGSEGVAGESLWLLHDYGDFVLHVFSGEGRDIYDLEGLWADAPRIDFTDPSRPAPVRPVVADFPAPEPDDADDADQDDAGISG